jgi:multidrug efflux pump subunit AcrB
VALNASPTDVRELNDVPIRTVHGTVVFVRDVAHVHDGAAPQINLVRVDGHHSVLLSVLKTGGASTLQIIDQVKALLPSIRAQLPTDVNITATSDQSLFVRAAVNGVLREGAIAAALTALMVLLFLGTWRSTLIITISIPLSVLASIVCLSAMGETINIMTLGGLALAVGILVDNATVAIENINWHLEQGKDVEAAILDGAQQIALPTLVSTLCICIVFVPMFLLTGVSRFLFVPLAEAAVFATLASYVLSRTLVPTLAMYWLQKHEPGQSDEIGGNLVGRTLRAFAHGFAVVRERYHAMLGAAVHHGPAFIVSFMAIGATAFLLLPWLGRDFFPTVDSGQVRLHLRGRSGMRLEQTAELCDAVEAQIRRAIPASELDKLIDNIGLPNSGINLAYSTSAPIGPGDADIMISLRPGHQPTDEYVRKLRARLRTEFPSVTFSFLPADIVNQILNFGLPSPLDVQIVGESPANRAFANALLSKLRAIPGTVDLRIQQAFDYPQINVNVDRTNAALVGLTQQDIATDLLISLSGNSQTAPAFWVDPKNGVQYSVTTQAPQYRLTSLQDLAATPLTSGAAARTGNGGSAQLLANVASITRGVGQGLVSHYNSRPVIDIYGSVDGTDLGSVASAVRSIVDQVRPSLPRGSELIVRGQIETMRSSFAGLGFGVIGAIVLMYLLIVVNFQSWLDPLIIITALPAAFAGMVWMLFLTFTTISVPALIGAIMGVGVATANSILVVSFARERMREGLSATAAAVEAGFVRFRPVIMTALAMVVGMLPMALGTGEGGEQNAPLGRAVVGGLIFATFATLLFVPVVFAVIHEWRARHSRTRA